MCFLKKHIFIESTWFFKKAYISKSTCFFKKYIFLKVHSFSKTHDGKKIPLSIGEGDLFLIFFV